MRFLKGEFFHANDTRFQIPLIVLIWFSFHVIYIHIYILHKRLRRLKDINTNFNISFRYWVL